MKKLSIYELFGRGGRSF